jgi:hypothetical protein
MVVGLSGRGERLPSECCPPRLQEADPGGADCRGGAGVRRPGPCRGAGGDTRPRRLDSRIGRCRPSNTFSCQKSALPKSRVRLWPLKGSGERKVPDAALANCANCDSRRRQSQTVLQFRLLQPYSRQMRALKDARVPRTTRGTARRQGHGQEPRSSLRATHEMTTTSMGASRANGSSGGKHPGTQCDACGIPPIDLDHVRHQGSLPLTFRT